MPSGPGRAGGEGVTEDGAVVEPLTREGVNLAKTPEQILRSVVSQDRGYSLQLYHEGTHIGEYERSWASEESGDLAAKVREAEGVSDLLLDACKRSANGKIAVRFNKAAYRKEIRAYQENRKDPGMSGTVLALIPKPYWRRS